MPAANTKMSSANQTKPKLIGSSSSSRKAAAETARPPVANGRAPYRSDSSPRHRPDQEEAHGQQDHVDARPQRGLAEAVAVLWQPDPLQPDDQHELDAAPAQGSEQAGDVARGERPDPEQARPSRNMGAATLVSTQANRTSTAIPPKMAASAYGLIHPAGCPP